MSYVTLGKPRFRISLSHGGEVLVIPARKNILAVLFLFTWLGGWTVGGIAALRKILVEFHPFVAFWLCGWAVGWIVVTLVLSWMLTGRQRLRFIGVDLEIETSVFGLSRRALYRGRDIRGLKAVSHGAYGDDRESLPIPLFWRSGGAVRFNYGARTYSTGFGLEEPEAMSIIDWLRKRLPEAST